MWIVYCLAVIAVVVGLIFLLRYCDKLPRKTRYMKRKGTLSLGVFGLFFFSGLLALMLFVVIFAGDYGYKYKVGELVMVAMLALFDLASLWLCYEYFLTKYGITTDGLRYRRINARGKLMKWEEVRQVKYSRKIGCFLIMDASGVTLMIFKSHSNLPEFAKHVIAYVSHDAIEPGTIPELVALYGKSS